MSQEVLDQTTFALKKAIDVKERLEAQMPKEPRAASPAPSEASDASEASVASSASSERTVSVASRSSQASAKSIKKVTNVAWALKLVEFVLAQCRFDTGKVDAQGRKIKVKGSQALREINDGLFYMTASKSNRIVVAEITTAALPKEYAPQALINCKREIITALKAVCPRGWFDVWPQADKCLIVVWPNM